MKKYFSILILAACTMLTVTSCSDSEATPPEYDESAIIFADPEFASQAALYEIPEDLLKSGEASLTGINITESGKVILEITTPGGVKYVTYNVALQNNAYVVKDESGHEMGRIEQALSHASSEAGLKVTSLKVVIGDQTFNFNSTDVITVLKLVGTLTGSNTQRTSNVARTWSVTQLNIMVTGDVQFSMLENSGNLKAIADAAQEAGANLTKEEMAALNKNISSITLDKNGIFSLEYTNGISEVCKWQWTDAKQEVLSLLQLRANATFGNKFLTENSTITVNVSNAGIALTLSTDITGSKTYTAALTIVLKEE